MQKRRIATFCLLLCLAACAGASTDRGPIPEPKAETYSDNGVAFEYPDDWDEFPAKPAATSTGSNELWSATIGPDKTNLVNVTAYRLNVAVTEDNLSSIETELDQVIQGVVEQAGGVITDGPTSDTIAGFPAYTYTWQGVEVNGEPKDSEAYFLFDEDIEYFVNCQFSDETADEVSRGCAQVLDTFEVTGGPGA